MKLSVRLLVCLLPWFIVETAWSYQPPEPHDTIRNAKVICRLLAERNRILQNEVSLINFQGHEFKPEADRQLLRAQSKLDQHESAICHLTMLADKMKFAQPEKRQWLAQRFAIEADKVRLSQLLLYLQLTQLDEELNHLCLDKKRFSLPEIRPGQRLL